MLSEHNVVLIEQALLESTGDSISTLLVLLPLYLIVGLVVEIIWVPWYDESGHIPEHILRLIEARVCGIGLADRALAVDKEGQNFTGKGLEAELLVDLTIDRDGPGLVDKPSLFNIGEVVWEVTMIKGKW